MRCHGQSTPQPTATERSAAWIAVVPVKPLRAAKSRLRGAVPEAVHRDLVLAMARDTVAAVLACRAVARVVVICDDPAVCEELTALGALCLPDVPAAGLNAALSYGAQAAHRLAAPGPRPDAPPSDAADAPDRTPNRADAQDREQERGHRTAATPESADAQDREQERGYRTAATPESADAQDREQERGYRTAATPESTDARDEEQERGDPPNTGSARAGAQDTGLWRAEARGGAVLNGAPVVALTADLPAMRAEDLESALVAAALAGRRAFVPDLEGTGTVLLASPSGEALAPHFGPGSAAAHLRSGAVLLDGAWPSLRRDVDTAADLDAAVRLGLGAHTGQVLCAVA
jgi:2-phospho-L-lactate guanylyltransferase (CobY/MobA/RfbA family)